MTGESPAALYDRYARVVGERALPCALVDLDALERNVDRVASAARASGKRVRVASKSVRCLEVLRRVFARGGTALHGVMAYAAREAEALADAGYDDVLLAYPTARRADADALARANAAGRTVSIVADDRAQLAVLEAAARAHGTRIPVVVDVDVSLRALAGRLHIGVRRSPLHEPAHVVALAREVSASPHLAFHGVMGYDAHIAGLPDASPFARLTNGPKRALKAIAIPDVLRRWQGVVDALREAGMAPTVVNGGGTGSLEWCRDAPSLTEVTVGSGFLGGHLFDYYRGLSVDPALMYALQVVRRPGEGLVTCHGGGFVASGEAGADRLPIPWLPAGLRLLGMEGAGEVQTPLRVPAGVTLELGAPVFFRHAKAGELAEHFATYLLVRGDVVEAEAPTYRGAGHTFL